MNYLFIGLVLAGFLILSNANPNLQKGELIERVILEQTKGNYEGALEAFMEIAKLAKEQICFLSAKERSLFYVCYHYCHLQRLKNAVDYKLNTPTDSYLQHDNSDIILLNLFDTIESVTNYLATNSTADTELEYKGFFIKTQGDKIQYLSGFYPSSKTVNTTKLSESIDLYQSALDILHQFVSFADITVLDTYLRLSNAINHLELQNGNKRARPCTIALKGFENGVRVSTPTNPDLELLKDFLAKFC